MDDVLQLFDLILFLPIQPMGSTKKEVLVALARIAVGLFIAAVLYSMFSTSKFFAASDLWYMQYVPLAASLVCGAMVAYLLSREKPGADG